MVGIIAGGYYKKHHHHHNPNAIKPAPKAAFEQKRSVFAFSTRGLLSEAIQGTKLSKPKNTPLSARTITQADPQSTASLKAGASKKTMKQKMSHLFAELGRLISGQNWQPVSSELLNKVKDPKLKAVFVRRNDLIEQRRAFKERGRMLTEQTRSFEKAHGADIKALSRSKPPGSGVLTTPEGRSFNFDTATSPIERQQLHKAFKEAMARSPGYQSFSKGMMELSQIPAEREKMKTQIERTTKWLDAKLGF